MSTTASKRLERREGFLSRSDLADLGLPKRAVNAVFRALPIVEFPGFSRPFIRVEDYLRYVDEHTYDGRSKVQPFRSAQRRAVSWTP